MPIDIKHEFEIQQGKGIVHAGDVGGKIVTSFTYEPVDGAVPYMTEACLKLAVKEVTAIRKEAEAALAEQKANPPEDPDAPAPDANGEGDPAD